RSARAGPWLGVEKVEVQSPHLQAVANQQPERRVAQLRSQRAKHLVPGIRAIILSQLPEHLRLGVSKKSPQLILGDEIVCVSNLGLLEDTIFMLADQKGRDMLLKVK